MRTLLVPLLLLPLAAFAQADAPPPPEAASPPAEAATTTVLLDDREATEAALPEKILEVPPPEAEAAVSIRTDGRTGDVVEEYRQGGRLYMVKVRPQRGVPYTLMDTNGDGRLDESDGDGPVRPVYYTLYEWN